LPNTPLDSTDDNDTRRRRTRDLHRLDIRRSEPPSVGVRRDDDWRHPCFLTEREAVAYMEDRLRRIGIFE
jgi:hypothetical protein